MPPPVFRFAPSPNGYLHLGHAYSALLNFDLARQAGGRLLLRIEDIDADALQAGIRDRDLRRPRLARHRLGIPGTAAVRTSRATIAKRSKSSPARAWSIRVSRAGPKSQTWWRSGRRTLPGRAIPTGRRFIRGLRSRSRPTSARNCWNRARLMRCGSTWPRPAHALAISIGSNSAKVPMARPASWPPGPRRGATSSSRARRRRPAIICRW